MEQIIITKPDTTTWALMTRSAVTAVTRAEQKRALLGEDVINMTAESAIPLSFDIGDTINIFGSTYILNALPKLLKAGKRKFSYDITWEGRQYDLLKPIYLDEGVDGISISPDFPLTGNLEFFLGVLINNANRIFGAGVWVLGDCPTTDYRTLTFSNENCLAVLQRLCTQENFGKEFEIIENAGVCTINIKDAIGENHAITYEYGKGKGLFNLTRETVSEKDIVTRLYVFGANKNLQSDYRGYSQRLKLPGNDLSYIEDAGAIAAYGLIEGVKIFDEIFPHRTGTVSSLGATVDEFYDTSMDFDLNAVDGGGNTLYLIPGTTAKIHFNTGNLAGYEFGILSYDSGTKKFKIQTFKDERGLEFPNAVSSAFQITAGDNYVIIDIRMPQTYIDTAESALATAGNDYYALVSQPRVQYSQTFDELYFKQKYAGQSTVNIFGIGDNVPIKDTDIGVDKSIRLRSFRRDIIYPYRYALDLYDYSEEALMARLVSANNETSKIISNNNLNDSTKRGNQGLTGSDILAALINVDGAGSGLDADLLDGQHGSFYAPINAPSFTGVVSSAGSIHLADGQNLWISSAFDDTGGRVKLHHAAGGDAYFDYYEDLHFRSGAASSTDRIIFTSGGSLKSEALESLTTFSPGFFGNGYKVIETGGISNLEVDNLRVRGTLSAYELEINKISSVNGGLVISVANGTAYSVSGTTLYFDTKNGSNPIQFKVGDYIKAQNWTGASGEIITAYVGVVTTVTQGDGALGNSFIIATTISGTAWNGIELVQMGGSGVDRQSIIYITAHDPNNPYIAGYTGVTDGDFTGHLKFQLGNLTGIADDVLYPSGYGLYAQNVFLSGQIIIANPGDIDQTALANAAAAGATVGATWGTNLNSVPAFLGTAGGAGLYMGSAFMGYYDGSAWKSYIDNAGNCKFIGMIELGTSVDAYGYNIAIKGGHIWGNTGGNAAELSMNYEGFQGGISYTRNLVVYDGKHNPILSCIGGTRQVTMPVSLVVGSSSGNSSAILDLISTTKAFIPPRMTGTQRAAISSPVDGMIIFDTTATQFAGYISGGWVLFTMH